MNRHSFALSIGGNVSARVRFAISSGFVSLRDLEPMCFPSGPTSGRHTFALSAGPGCRHKARPMLSTLSSLALPVLHRLDSQQAHILALRALSLGLVPPAPDADHPALGVTVLGRRFSNPIGLAAVFDKNAVAGAALMRLGFGFVETGTVTPRPQPGNPRPRLFRLTEASAIINRFGFNNVGVDAFLANVSRARYKGILVINIGKNFDTPLDQAADDYVLCLERV